MEALIFTLGVLIRVALPVVLLFALSARARAWDMRQPA